MQFSELNRRLEASELDHHARFIISHMFEVQVEFSKAIDAVTTLMDQIVNRMQEVMAINNDMVQQINALKRRGQVDGVEVHSVRRDPDDE